MRTFDRNSPGHKTRFSGYDIKGILSHSQLSFYKMGTTVPCELKITFIR